MSQYFRITAYHPQEDISVIMDSNGMFEKLWQFSSMLIQKGFKILEVGSDEKFGDGNIDKTEYDSEHIILRANDSGKPIYLDYQLQGISYRAVQVNGKTYIPDREVKV